MFQATLNLYAGPGCLDSLVTATGGLATMVVTDAGCRDAGLLDLILDALLPARPVAIADFLAFEPTTRDVRQVASTITKASPDCIVAVGGGSAIDLAKAAAAIAANGGGVRDYVNSSYADYTADALHADPIPVIAIPTTAGTGSEVTRNAAITDSDTGEKLALRSPRLVPRAQFLDPGLLRTCPPHVIAQSGLDAAAHALEGMMSTLASAGSDEIALDALRRLLTALPLFCREPADPGLALQMQLGSLMAGAVLNDCATVTAHALARAMGGVSKLAHGLSVALVLPETLRFNAAESADPLRRVAAALGLDEQQPAESVATALEEMRESLGIPDRLRAAGIRERDLAPIAATASAFTELNPRPAGAEELTEILRTVF